MQSLRKDNLSQHVFTLLVITLHALLVTTFVVGDNFIHGVDTFPAPPTGRVAFGREED